MTDTNTYSYFTRYIDHFWQWDGEFIRVNNGPTLGHWQQVCEYMIAIAHQGLPPFNIFLAVFAATAKNDVNELDAIKDEIRSITDDQQQVIREEFLQECLQFFDTVALTPIRYREGSNRLLMVAAILSKSHVKIRTKVSMQIAEQLKDRDNARKLFGANKTESSKKFVRFLNCLRVFNNNFPNPQSIIDHMAGFEDLEHVIEEFELPLEGETSDQGLIESLLGDSRTRKMALLIPHLQAGIHIPISSTYNDKRPEGGVSNLSNKGELHQLVISEYAYDTDLFLTRIVNNEALFYERERAPQDKELDQCILIDTSIYMWGIPKLLSFAISSALSTKNNKVNVKGFTLGDEVQPFDNYELIGIIEGQKSASIALNCSKAIYEFVQSERQFTNTILVTTEQSLVQPEMASALQFAKPNIDVIVKVSEEGEVKVNKASGKLIADLKLDLPAIWEKKKKQASQRDRSHTHQSPIPVLFPVDIKRKRFFVHFEGEYIYVDRYRSLFSIKVGDYDGVKKGAKFHAQVNLSGSIVGSVGYNNNNEKEVLLFGFLSKTIVIYNFSTGQERVIGFHRWHDKLLGAFYHHEGVFIYCHNKGFWRFDEEYKEGSNAFEPDALTMTPEQMNAQKVDLHRFSVNETFWVPPYRHIKSVGISNFKELIIGGKVFGVSDNDDFRIESTPAGEDIEYADVSEDGRQKVFRFDNYRIEIFESGMLRFVFPEKQKGYKLELNRVGANKLVTVQLIRQYSIFNLRECKEIADAGSGDVAYFRSKEEATKAQEHFTESGNEMTVTEINLGSEFWAVSATDAPLGLASDILCTGPAYYAPNNSNQHRISPMEFSALYLKPFINQTGND